MRLIALLLCAATHAAVGQATVYLERRGEGYPVYRIPALVLSNAGTLIAAYDGRPTMSDVPSNIAVVVRRSSDGGATWGARVAVRADTAPLGFGDPSLLVDRITGRIFLFHVASVQQGFFGSATGNADDDPGILHADLSWSDDDGVTWQHRRLTSLVKSAEWSGLFASSGSGIQLRSGRYAGRLVQQFVVRNGSANYGASLYSDDHGTTWRMGALVGPDVDENKSVELADGTLLLNSRARPFRLVARSEDGGEHWGALRADSQLVDPGNNGAVVRYDESARASDAPSHWLLFSNTADAARRVNLTVKLSCDDGRTWPVRRTVVGGPVGYSTLAMLPGGDIGVLFEAGDYEAIAFTRFPLAWLGACPGR